MPVRMFQEGRASGSRAELESFTDIAATIMESRNHVLATAIQEQIINHLTLINFGIEHLVEIQVGNVKQSRLFFARHPTLDPNQNQEQREELQEQHYEDVEESEYRNQE
jgi:sensor domain CHASE-containing protein